MSDIPKCGFCELLTGLLRRVMCAGNRRGSSESCYRELDDQDTLVREVCEHKAKFEDQSSVCSIISDRSDDMEEPIDFANDDYIDTPMTREEVKAAFVAPWSLEGIPPQLIFKDTERTRPLGSFYSLQRRNVRKPTSYGLKMDGLLDNSYPNKVQLLFERHLHKWDFDTQILNLASGDRVLPLLCMYLFKYYSLITIFNLSDEKCWKLFQIIDEAYHAKNPYHNAVHAADVTQAVHCFMQQNKMRAFLEPIDAMMLLLAAITHDLDHPGVNQNFITKTQHALFQIYKAKTRSDREAEKKKKDKIPKPRPTLEERYRKYLEDTEQIRKEQPSILERHHWRAAYSCIIQSGIFDHMKEYLPYIKETLASLILATDITRQNEYLDAFKRHVKRKTLDMDRLAHRHMVLQMALKAADISNPGRTWLISKKWSMKVCDEFFFQGDKERQCNMEISQFCDRNKESVPDIQIGFFKFVVSPLFKEWSMWLHTDVTDEMCRNLLFNQYKWELEALKYTNNDHIPESNERALRQALAAVRVPERPERNSEQSAAMSSGQASTSRQAPAAPAAPSVTKRIAPAPPVPAPSPSTVTKKRMAPKPPLHKWPNTCERLSCELRASRDRPTSPTIPNISDSASPRRFSLSPDQPRNSVDDGARRFSAPLQVLEARARTRGKKESIPECLLTEELQSSGRDVSGAYPASDSRKIASITNSVTVSGERNAGSNPEHLIQFDVSPQPRRAEASSGQGHYAANSDGEEAPVADDNTDSAEDFSGSQRALTWSLNNHLQGLLVSFSSNMNSSDSHLYQPFKEDTPSVMQKTEMLFPRVLKQVWERRRGSAPATSDVRPLASLTHQLGDSLKPRHQWVPRAQMPRQHGREGRRSSLPVEVMAGRACVPA